MNSKTEAMLTWTRALHWVESEDRTDASLKVEIGMSLDDTPEARGAQEYAMTWTKNDYLDFVNHLCAERTDAHSIDAICIKMDGDEEYTTIYIEADIHLAE